jgi:hypothetical protein
MAFLDGSELAYLKDGTLERQLGSGSARMIPSLSGEMTIPCLSYDPLFRRQV